MDTIYTVNSQSRDLRWGDPATGNLSNVVSLGFNCYQITVLAGQRYLYVTGTKHHEGDPPNLRYAWLAVVDTCSNAVVKELNLGVGYGGQCAVPSGIRGILAFVAISRASGSDPAAADTGSQGGSNRIEALNIADVADPVLSGPSVSIPGSPYGTLWIVWSNTKSLLYTSHRGDSHIFAFPPTRAKPVVAPDGSNAYVPRGGQDDLAQIDLPNNVLTTGFIGVGNRPADAAIISHAAGQRLEAAPAHLTMECNEPQAVMIRAFDACDNELQGVSVSALSSALAVNVTPANQITPAQFSIECLQGGSHSVTFAATNFPYGTVSIPITCNCPVMQCVDFATLPQGPLSPMGALLAGIAQVSLVVLGVGSGPIVTSTSLRIFGSTLLFQLNPGLTIHNLVIRYRRQDPFTPLEQVTITLEDGTTLPPLLTPQGFAQGDFEVACPFQGIREWLLTGGVETVITEMCFDANFKIVS